jgi:hypothetical protein
MGITSDRTSVRISDALVTITSTSGVVSPTWTVEVDGTEVAREKIGDAGTLIAPLPDGTTAEVEVDQRAFGPNTVVVRQGGRLMAEFNGFLA